MDAPTLIARLERFPRAYAATIEGLSDADFRFKPPTGAWSILEVTCHLGDEEVEDFRARLFQTLADPKKPWPLTNPEAWARDRKYNQQNPAAALQRFIHERARSVEMLLALKSPDWTTAYHHPRHGPVATGELLTAWPAHDALHLRQVAKRLFELAGRDGSPWGTKYAGEWGA